MQRGAELAHATLLPNKQEPLDRLHNLLKHDEVGPAIDDLDQPAVGVHVVDVQVEVVGRRPRVGGGDAELLEIDLLVLHHPRRAADEPGDDEKTNKYTRARSLLESWRAAGVLTLDDDPAVTVYEMRYSVGDERRASRGVLAAVSLMAHRREAQPATMTMMGGPIDARRSPTAVNNLARRKPYSWFERHLIERVPAKYPGYMRRVYPGFLQHLGFVAMNPDRHLIAHWDYYHKLVLGDGESAEAHRRFYDEYNAVLDMPAEYYLDTVKTVFQDFALPKGRMVVRDELVRPQAIRDVALLTIEGELDDISGNGQTEAAHTLCTGIPAKRREHYLVPGVGHYGIFSGRRWRAAPAGCGASCPRGRCPPGSRCRAAVPPHPP